MLLLLNVVSNLIDDSKTFERPRQVSVVYHNDFLFVEIFVACISYSLLAYGTDCY